MISINRYLLNSNKQFIRDKFITCVLSTKRYSSLVTDEGIINSPAPDLSLPEGNLAATCIQSAAKWKDATAFVCSETGHQITYSELIDQSQRWSGFLKKSGLGPGSVVSTVINNCPQYAPLFIGTIAIGAIFSPINSKLMPGEISKLLLNNEASFVIISESSEVNVQKAIKLLKKTFRLLSVGKTTNDLPNVDEILRDKSIPFADPIQISGDEIAFLPFSSGTTGPPKAVAVSHNCFLRNNMQLLNPYHNYHPRTAADGHIEHYIGMLPFFHIYGMFMNVSVGIHVGAKTITLPNFDPEKFISILTKNQITTLHCVPTLLNFLNTRPECNNDSLTNLELVVCGAAPVLPTSVERFKEKLNKSTDLNVIEEYGMTEIMVANVVARGTHRYGTAGQFLSNVKGKVVDLETGKNLGPHQDGEICIKTPAKMVGYYKNPEATSQMIRDDWVYTGDVGHYDEDGYLYLVDRTKDLIKVKGLQVSPSEIEEVLQTHPAVVESCVIGIPDDRAGEVPKAFVIVRSKVHEEDLKKHVAAKVAKHKHLVGGITFVEDFPKTETGKILKKELRKIYDHSS